MRATTHNSRTNSKGTAHSAKHNDRNFDISKSDNIDTTKAQDNIYWNCFENPNMTFEEAELKAYEKMFSKQLDKTNQNYIENRHPERCKTMEQFIRSRQYCPEETVLQVGKTEKHIDEKTLIAIYNDYRAEMDSWNDAHGRPFLLLNSAVHVDEAVPHVQQRRAWKYLGEDGIYRVGQEKALKQAGIALPDPNKPEGRYNNRKMTFDDMSRTIWLSTCERHGIEVEWEPVPNAKHNRDKQEMIRDKYEELIIQTEEQEYVLDKATQKTEDILFELERTKEELENAQNELFEAKQELRSTRAEKVKLEGSMKAQKEEFERELPALQAQISDAKNELKAKEAELKEKQRELELTQQVIDEQMRKGRDLGISMEQARERIAERRFLDKVREFFDAHPAVKEAFERFAGIKNKMLDRGDKEGYDR